MELSLFDYELPVGLIAQSPIEPRESSRLMIIEKEVGLVEQNTFNNLGKYLRKDDVLVFNQSKVIPARLLGKKTTGGKVEVLLLRFWGENCWEALCKPGMKVGKKVIFGYKMKGVITEKKSDGTVKIRLNFPNDELSRVGMTPIPPYIHSDLSEKELRKKYQTIYAKDEGSVAAPTAGFHFSRKLLENLKRRGVIFEYLTLHVSLGTFRGVKTERIEDHLMHSEWFCLGKEIATRLNKYKGEGRRIISVGTTTARVLETCTDEKGILKARTGDTNIFIYPPYKFKFIDGLITNFHLPKSTLLMLVSALVSEPNTKNEFVNFQESVIGKAYQKAIKEKYRFFSFGDGMIIV